MALRKDDKHKATNSDASTTTLVIQVPTSSKMIYFFQESHLLATCKWFSFTKLKLGDPYVSPCNWEHLIDPCYTTFLTISKLCTRSKNKGQPTFFCKCPCKKCFSCSRRSREKDALSWENYWLCFLYTSLKYSGIKRAVFIFNRSWKDYPNKLHTSFIILHGVSHIYHQLIKQIPNNTTSLCIDFVSPTSPTGWRSTVCNENLRMLIDRRREYGELKFYQDEIFCISHIKQLIILFVKKTTRCDVEKHNRLPYKPQNQYSRQ